MIGFGAPAMAQNNNAVIEEVSKLIKTHGDGEAIKAIFKANKKNPEVLLGMGRAYLEVKDTANASKYANLALARNKKYAKAFILLGDIAVFADDGGSRGTDEVHVRLRHRCSGCAGDRKEAGHAAPVFFHRRFRRHTAAAGL